MLNVNYPIDSMVGEGNYVNKILKMACDCEIRVKREQINCTLYKWVLGIVSDKLSFVTEIDKLT